MSKGGGVFQFSIFRRADDVTRTMSKGGACECLHPPPPSGTPVSALGPPPPPPFKNPGSAPATGASIPFPDYSSMSLTCAGVRAEVRPRGAACAGGRWGRSRPVRHACGVLARPGSPAPSARCPSFLPGADRVGRGPYIHRPPTHAHCTCCPGLCCGELSTNQIADITYGTLMSLLISGTDELTDIKPVSLLDIGGFCCMIRLTSFMSGSV